MTAAQQRWLGVPAGQLRLKSLLQSVAIAVAQAFSAGPLGHLSGLDCGYGCFLEL